MKVARSEEPVRNWADVNNKHTNHNLHWAVVLQDWRKTFLFTLVNILRPHSCSLMTFTAIHSHSAYITIVTTVQPTYERTPRSVGRIDSLWKYIWRYSYVCNLAAVSLDNPSWFHISMWYRTLFPSQRKQPLRAVSEQMLHVWSFRAGPTDQLYFSVYESHSAC